MPTTTAQAVAAGWKFPVVQTTVNGGQSPTVTLTVNGTTGFSSTGGTAWVKETQFTYTGKSGVALTGCSGLPGTVADLDVVLIGGLTEYRAEHLLNGCASVQSTQTPATLVAGIDGLKVHNATANTRGQKWQGETI